jgi:hypothetical protein
MLREKTDRRKAKNKIPKPSKNGSFSLKPQKHKVLKNILSREEYHGLFYLVKGVFAVF